MTNKSLIITSYLAVSVFIANPTSGQTSDFPENHRTVSDTTYISHDSLTVIVYVTFIVDNKGRVKNVELLKTECDSCDSEIKKNCENEAIRVVSEMPKWEPKRTKGKLQKQRYNLPFKFVLPKDIKKEENE